MLASPGGSSQGGVLSGLRARPDLSAFAKGKQMQLGAQAGLENAQQVQQAGVQQMQQESQLRQQDAGNKAQRAGNDSQYRMNENQMRNRMAVFNASLGYDQAAVNKQRQLGWQQTLLNNLIGEL
jgi:hypothetical protein